MKVFADFLPILIFFITYKFYDLYIATAVLMVASALVMLWQWMSRGRVEVITVVSTALILVFGGLTLLLQDEIFVKMKPTLLYAFFFIALLATHWNERNLLERLLASQIGAPLEKKAWRSLNGMWAVFFAMMAVLNTAVAFYFSTDTWMNFKLFGFFGLTLAFVLFQGFWIASHMPDTPEEDSSQEAGK